MTWWKTVALLGPNRWSARNILEAHTDGARYGQPPHGALSIAQTLRDFLDSGRYTTTHPASVSVAYDALSRIESAATYGKLWLAVSQWMSAMSGVPSVPFAAWVTPHDATMATPSTANPYSGATQFDCVIALEMEEELLSRRCYEMAEQLIAATVAGEPYPIPTKFRELFDYADDVRLGPSSRAILDAAIARGIPFYRLTSGSLVQLGEGCNYRRIWTAETDATSAIAESIASDKDLTKRLLRNVGVPVPLGRMVAGPDDAWVAAQEVGMPVVVKPRDANHQRGISIELTQEAEIFKAYHWAIEDGQTKEVMVEQFARGQHHRLLVVGDRMVAASRGHFETITGDGVKSVEQLVFELNQDPRRGEAYTDPLGVLKLDAAAQIELSKQDLTIASIPERGRVVLIRRTGDLTTDCTDEVHPETARQAALAARVVGLDVAGLDVLAVDISKPLVGQRGAVVEVNAGPSLTPHVAPLFGKPREVGAAIVEMLFPEHHCGRIPIAGVLDINAGGDRSVPFAQALSSLGWDRNSTGIVPARNVWLGDECIELGRLDYHDRAKALLGNPAVQALVFLIDPDYVITHGFPVPRIDHLWISSAGAEQYHSDAWDQLWSAIRNTLIPEAQVALESSTHPASVQCLIRTQRNLHQG
ncbi:MAG: cyanophycin synthetase [Planctomycetes bacterium]|nr:cyanophycin synthetase [Planctomycetota bacterium]